MGRKWRVTRVWEHDLTGTLDTTRMPDQVQYVYVTASDTGDPHITTGGGKNYDFQQAGGQCHVFCRRQEDRATGQARGARPCVPGQRCAPDRAIYTPGGKNRFYLARTGPNLLHTVGRKLGNKGE